MASTRLTESSSALRGSTLSSRACRRSSEATVCRLFFTRWWISWASTPRITARPCSSATAACCAIEARSSRSYWVNGERAVGDELADLAAAPAERLPDRVGIGATLGPSDRAVLEHERRPGRRERVHRGLHDRLERFLEVERLRDRAGDAGERLELMHASLRLLVELRVLDRLGHLGGDRQQELDLVLSEDAPLARAHVEGTLEPLAASEDRHGEDRLVLVLGQVGEVLEARVEVGLRGDHDGGALLRGRAGDPLPRPHARPLGHLFDARAVRRAQDELLGPLVEEVDEAGVGPKRVGDLRRNLREHLLEVEGRVDRLDRLREQLEMALAPVHSQLKGTHARPGPATASGSSIPARSSQSPYAQQRIPTSPSNTVESVTSVEPDLRETVGYVVADASGRIVGRVECPCSAALPKCPTRSRCGRGSSSRRRLVPAESIEQIDGGTRVIGLRIERESIRSFL